MATEGAPRTKERLVTRIDRPRRDPASAWWLKDDGRIHEVVLAQVDRIERQQAGRLEDHQRYEHLYQNEPPAVAPRIATSWKDRRISFNVVRSCIQTASAKIARARPRPIFLTQGGDFALQRKAEGLTQWMDGAFQASGIYDEAPRAFIDACLYDGGALRVFVDETSEDEPEIRVERVWPREILIDEVDGAYGRPRQLHHKRLVNRDVLYDLFPTAADAIARAPSTRFNARIAGIDDSDMVVVVESWHLPSGPKAVDGRHAISLDGATLLAEPYTKAGFPFLFYFWDEPLEGFWGTGLAAELLGLQLEITRTLSDIQLAQHRMGNPRILVPKGAKVNRDQWTSQPGGLVEFDPTAGAPVVFPPVTVAPDVYAHLDRLIRTAYEITGISQAAAGARKPAGVTAAVAIREVEDIASERLMRQGQRFERLFLDAAQLFVELARDLYEDGRNIHARSTAGKFLRSIPWDEVSLNDDQFVMQVFPTSLLPTQPAGRLQTVTELVQAGFVERDEALALLDFPDVKRAMDLRTAALDDARMVVDSMLSGGDYIAPEPYMDLALARSIAQSAYLRGRIDRVPEGDLQKLRDFMEACTDLLSPPAEAAPASPSPPPGVPAAEPMAVPPAAPMSDLLPIGSA